MQIAWKNLKQAAKKALSEYKQAAKKTGGGEPPEDLSDLILYVLQVSGTNTSLENVHDSETLLSEQTGLPDTIPTPRPNLESLFGSQPPSNSTSVAESSQNQEEEEEVFNEELPVINDGIPRGSVVIGSGDQNDTQERSRSRSPINPRPSTSRAQGQPRTHQRLRRRRQTVNSLSGEILATR